MKAQRLRKTPTEAGPRLGVFPPHDLGLIVQVVLSLFCLLLSYDAICGEKEAGTLRLKNSFSVPRRLILLGKGFGILLPAMAAFGLPLLLGRNFETGIRSARTWPSFSPGSPRRLRSKTQRFVWPEREWTGMTDSGGGSIATSRTKTRSGTSSSPGEFCSCGGSRKA